MAFAVVAATVVTGLSLVAPAPAGADPVQTPRNSVSVGSAHACAVTSAGGAMCWGSNSSRQLGNGTTTSSSAPVTVTGLSSGVVAIDAGHQSTCAVTSTGGATCWGANTNGVLGDGTTTASAVPVAVSGLSSGVVGISTGGSTTAGSPLFGIPSVTIAHACAVTGVGGVKCWGSNSSGQLGNGTTTNSSVPVDVSGLGPGSGVTAVSVGTNNSCALTSSGAVKCWGNNGAGRLGNGSTTSSSVPVAVVGLSSGATSVSVGSTHACATTAAGAVRCWGVNSSGQLGTGTTTSSSTPVTVTGLATAAAVTVGSSHTCALSASGAVSCWGASGISLGVGSLTSSTTPVAVPTLTSGVVALHAGPGTTCVLTTTGAARCWGGNGGLQLGNGTPYDNESSVPVPVAGLPAGTISAIDAGETFTCALISGGVWCWGEGTLGQLGNGTSATTAVPAMVSGLGSGVTAISAGRAHACAITAAGAAMCWGSNEYGQLGNGTTTSAFVPVEVSGLGSGVAAISAGAIHTCAVTTAGAAKCWGNGGSFLGDGTTNASTVPVDVVGLSSGVASIAAGGSQSCAVTDTAVLKCWGENSFGQMGIGSTTSNFPSPVVVTSLTTPVLQVDSGNHYVCALLSTGAVTCWGSNTFQQLGVTSPIESLVPVATVGMASDVGSLTVGFEFACGLLSSGQGRCWGNNQRSQLGKGSVSSFAPGDVVGLGTSLAQIEAGRYHACGVTTGGAAVCWGANSNGVLGSVSSNWVPGDVTGGHTFGPGSVAGPTIVGSRSPAANAAGWNNEPVSVSFTCTSDALASCTQPTTVSTDGTGQSVTGSASDLYGQSATDVVSGVNIDRVAPTLAGLATTSPNGAGWYQAPVTMSWTCDDDRSGVAACPADDVTVGEGPAVSLSASVADRAGNSVTATSQSVAIDLTAPSTGVSSPPTWSKQSVTLTLSPTDALSGVASTNYRIDGGETQAGTSPVVSGEGTHTVEFWSSDMAGNMETPTSVTVKIDLSAPSITPRVSPAPNANGWHRGPVDVTFTCADTGGSDVSTCTGDRSLSAEVDTVVTGNAADNAGNTSSAQATVRIDLTAPTVTGQVPPPNAYGWFNAQVQVPFSCSDTGGSGVDTCPVPVMFAGEGEDQPVSGSGQDNAGNVGYASGDTVSLDLTAPTISGAVVEADNGNGGYYGVVHVRFTCEDALSGVVACPADQEVSGEGVHVVSGSVNDKAGNTASTDVTVRIEHDTSTDPGMVHGTATDQSTGDPVAGALVRLHHPTSGATLYSTTTGTDGTYVFPIVADGSYVVSFAKSGVYLSGYYPNVATNSAAQVLVVSHGSSLTADQALTPGHVLSGTVTSAAGGVPLAGASVVLSNGTRATTDSSGRYEIRGLAPATLGLTITAYGYTPVTASAAVPAVGVLDRALAPAGASSGIKGIITSLTPGGPLAGATVRVYPKDAAAFGTTVSTDAAGRYSLPTLPAGVYHVDVVRGDYRVRWAADAATRSGAAAITVTVACTTTPDATWGNPCATPVNIRMQRP